MLNSKYETGQLTHMVVLGPQHGPRHHSKTTGFGLVSFFFFFFSSKDTLYPTPETNMVGMRLEWSSLTNYNICYLKNIFIYSSGNYEAHKTERKDAFVTIKSGCSNGRNVGKDRGRAAVNAASTAFTTSQSATGRSPRLLCATGHNMTGVTLSLPV